MFIVFKAWFHYNMEHKFTSLEVGYVYKELSRRISDKVTLHKLLTEMVNIDPVAGICYEA